MLLVLSIFVVGIIICYFLAKLFLKYVSKSVRPVISIVLYGVAFYLAYLSYAAVMDHINFKKEKVERYTKVIEKLKLIRDAQADHRLVTKKYAATGDQLIAFIDTAQFAVTKDTNMVRTVNLGGGITGEEEYLVTDTIGFTDVRAAYVGRDYKNMMKVPGTDSLFTLNIGQVQKSHGDMRNVFEAKVRKELVLNGLNPDLIRLEEKAEANDEVKGEYVRVGSLVDVTDSGNWPPSYDFGDVKKK